MTEFDDYPHYGPYKAYIRAVMGVVKRHLASLPDGAREELADAWTHYDKTMTAIHGKNWKRL